MNKESFLNGILPGNYFITKSMELTKVSTSGTLWYTKKFIVLYYFIFLNGNIKTMDVVMTIRTIFNSFIDSLPEILQEDARKFFYSSKPVADLRNEKFKLFDVFAGQRQFANDKERIAYYEIAKKYYLAFLMESGGQKGIKRYIKQKLYEEDFNYGKLNEIIEQYAKEKGYPKKYKSIDRYVTGMRNDYMSFVRNERQVLFYYGFFHSKSSGSKDLEFSSLTPVGDLALNSNYYELIALWEHQKIKMVSQPVNIEIRNLTGCDNCNIDSFSINMNPYLTILKSLKATNGLSNDIYQFIISRMRNFPKDNQIDSSEDFIGELKSKVKAFKRKADLKNEDFKKELLKYLLGVRSDLKKDKKQNPLGLCKSTKKKFEITNENKLNRLIDIYSIICEYKCRKYSEVILNSEKELKQQYCKKVKNEKYKMDPQIKIGWDMYIIHTDILILLASTVLVLEGKNEIELNQTSLNVFVDSIMSLCPNILNILGLSNKIALKKELKRLTTVFIDRNFEIYFKDLKKDYSNDFIYLKNESLKDLEHKIANENSCLSSIYEDGSRKRNTNLISLIKTYNIKKYFQNGKMLKCECCGNSTFVTYKNEPYVEYHHLIPFSEYDGPDHNLNILALCPMCHRKFHFLKSEEKKPLYKNVATHSYKQLSIEKRMVELYNECKLKSYQLEFLLADNAIDQKMYNTILDSVIRENL